MKNHNGFRRNRFTTCLYMESYYEYKQRIPSQYYCWKIFPRHLIPYSQERVSKYYYCPLRNYSCFKKKNTRAAIRRQRFLRPWRWNLARRYISTLFVYTLPRIRTSNVHKSHKRKWFHNKKKCKKQTIFLRNWCCIAALWRNETVKLFFIKYKTLFFITRKVEIGCKCERDEGRKHRLVVDCYIDFS